MALVYPSKYDYFLTKVKIVPLLIDSGAEKPSVRKEKNIPVSILISYANFEYDFVYIFNIK